jgi:hypothetical protein
MSTSPASNAFVRFLRAVCLSMLLCATAFYIIEQIIDLPHRQFNQTGFFLYSLLLLLNLLLMLPALIWVTLTYPFKSEEAGKLSEGGLYLFGALIVAWLIGELFSRLSKRKAHAVGERDQGATVRAVKISSISKVKWNKRIGPTLLGAVILSIGVVFFTTYKELIVRVSMQELGRGCIGFLMFAVVIGSTILGIRLLYKLIVLPDSHGERSIRGLSALAGLTLYFISQITGVSISEILVKSISTYSTTFWLANAFIPAVLGYLTANFFIKHVNKGDNISERVVILFGTLLISEFTEVFVRASSQNGLAPSPELLPNFTFVLVVILYAIFRYQAPKDLPRENS